MLQTNLDTLLFCSNLLCRKLPQVSEYGPWILKKFDLGDFVKAIAGFRHLGYKEDQSRFKNSIPDVEPKGGIYQGCQTAYFQTKNPNLGKFLKFLQ
jgi:hypothetical protein